jgi:hypothetical protein
VDVRQELPKQFGPRNEVQLAEQGNVNKFCNCTRDGETQLQIVTTLQAVVDCFVINTTDKKRTARLSDAGFNQYKVFILYSLSLSSCNSEKLIERERVTCSVP